MTKFINKLDLQIRLKLATRNLIALIIYNFGKTPVNIELEELYKLNCEEFLEKLKSVGISINKNTDEIFLKAIFEEYKKRVSFIEDELNRYDEIAFNNKSRF